jgi:Cys-rich repeat protein
MRGIGVIVLVAGCALYERGDDTCLEPEVAQQLRDPSTGQCETIGSPCPCGAFCEPPANPTWPACAGACDALSENACLAAPGCHATYLARHGAPVFAACWDLPITSASTGTCAGLSAVACAEHDNCASMMASTTTGELAFTSCDDEPSALCLADSDCPGGESCDHTTCHLPPCDPGPSGGACGGDCFGVCVAVPCDTLATDAACQARNDCSPVYSGTDCTCDSSGHCTCQDLTFERCQPRP